MQQLIYDRTEQNKGKLSAPMLNRIEDWTAYLAAVLAEYGYLAAVHVRQSAWHMTDIPTRGDIDRIRRNIDALQTGFYSLPDWREILYNNTLDYVQANALEWDLQRIYDWLESMVQSFRFRHADTFFMESGGVFNA